MSGKILIAKKPDGTEIYGERVEVTKEDSRWLKFELEDGSVIRAKVVLTRVTRAIDEFVPSGDPLYAVQHNLVLDVIANEEFKKKDE